mmetsp:Transcript_63901/g.101299  ORF Transcript_63901/g.101299 Transcript_63901/m.101299 type:complete len:555 (-) Transcript_63901:64-1728(-)
MGCGATSARYELELHGASAMPPESNAADVDTASPISLGGQWYYESSPDEWNPMDAEISAELLVAWYCDETDVTYRLGDVDYDVDLASCIQTNKVTGAQQRIGFVASDSDQDGAMDDDLRQEEVSEAAWVEYDEDDMQEVLAAWASGSKVVRYTSNGYEFEIDFTKMLQTNLTTGAQQWVGVEMIDDGLPAGEQQGSEWVEYIDADSGKPYYYNGQTTTWERPTGNGVRIHTAEDFDRDLPSRANSKTSQRETDSTNIQPSSSRVQEITNKGSAKLDVPQKPTKKFSLSRDPPAKAEAPSSQAQNYPSSNKPRQPTQFYTPEAPPFNPQAAAHYNSSADWQPPWMPPAHTQEDAEFDRPPKRHNKQANLGTSDMQDPHTTPPSTRPQARLYKTTDPNKPRPKLREKKYTLGPEKSAPRLSQKERQQQQPQPKQMPRPQPTQPPFTHSSNTQSETKTPPYTQEKAPKQQPIGLPIGAEWPSEPKARKVAETLFRDMCASRDKPLKERQKAYRASCLSWHPDKNPKYVELSTEVFKFLQVLKQWYFEEQKPEHKTAT